MTCVLTVVEGTSTKHMDVSYPPSVIRTCWVYRMGDRVEFLLKCIKDEKITREQACAML